MLPSLLCVDSGVLDLSLKVVTRAGIRTRFMGYVNFLKIYTKFVPMYLFLLFRIYSCVPHLGSVILH